MYTLKSCLIIVNPKFRLFFNETIILLIPLVLINFVLGCASVTRGTKDVLVVESNPPGASVRLSNGMSGMTPTSFELPRKNILAVDISKAGYEPVTIRVTPKTAGAGSLGFAGNVLIGGLIGAAVDLGTGATKDLVPNPVFVNLVKIDSRHANVPEQKRNDLFKTSAIPKTSPLLQFDDIREAQLAALDKINEDSLTPVLRLPKPQILLQRTRSKLVLTAEIGFQPTKLAVAASKNGVRFYYYWTNNPFMDGKLEIPMEQFTDEGSFVFAGEATDINYMEIWVPGYEIMVWQP